MPAYSGRVLSGSQRMKKGARKRPGLHSRWESPERAPKPARSTCICSRRNVFSPWPAGEPFIQRNGAKDYEPDDLAEHRRR
jgi:hypothetical protein